MALHPEYDYDGEGYEFSDAGIEDDAETLSRRKRARKMLEDRMEQKRLRQEFRESWEEDDEFDWDDKNW